MAHSIDEPEPYEYEDSGPYCEHISCYYEPELGSRFCSAHAADASKAPQPCCEQPDCGYDAEPGKRFCFRHDVDETQEPEW